MTPLLWICLPTYNERENLPRMIDALGAEFEKHGLDGHVLVIDDNSPDGTGQIADELATTRPWLEVLHRTAKEGLGRAYLNGFEVALAHGADLIMEMDCDFSHSPTDVHRLVEAAGEADLVLGSRNVPGGGVKNWPVVRRLISKGGSWYARTILGVNVRDLTGGFKCFNRKVLEQLDFSRVDAQGYALPDRTHVPGTSAGVFREGSAHHLRRPRLRRVKDEGLDRRRGDAARLDPEASRPVVSVSGDVARHG